MFKNKKIVHYLGFCSVLVLGLLSGCMTLPHRQAAAHPQSLGSTKEREMTVGVVQKEIRRGMSQADVAEALGSPNIVTKDSVGDETWIYDKIATEASYSRSGQQEKFGAAGGGGGGRGGRGGPWGGGAGGGRRERR